MLVHQSLDYFVVVVIRGCTDNGSVRHWVLCVFIRKYKLCVGLMLWIRVVVAFLMFCLLPLLCLSLSLGVCVSGGIVVGVSGLFCGWLVDFCVEFCVYLF